MIFDKYVNSGMHISKFMVLNSYTPHLYGLGAKSQILSSVASPRKKNFIAILRLVYIYSAWKTMFY